MTKGAPRPRPPRPPKPVPTVDEVVRRYVLARLAANGGHKGRTAAECGVAVKTIYNWLERWAAEVALPGEQARRGTTMDGLLSAIRGHRRMLEWAESVGDEKLAASQRHSLAFLLGLSVERVIIPTEGNNDGQANGLVGLPTPADRRTGADAGDVA